MEQHIEEDLLKMEKLLDRAEGELRKKRFDKLQLNSNSLIESVSKGVDLYNVVEEEICNSLYLDGLIQHKNIVQKLCRGYRQQVNVILKHFLKCFDEKSLLIEQLTLREERYEKLEKFKEKPVENRRSSFSETDELSASNIIPTSRKHHDEKKNKDNHPIHSYNRAKSLVIMHANSLVQNDKGQTLGIKALIDSHEFQLFQQLINIPTARELMESLVKGVDQYILEQEKRKEEIKKKYASKMKEFEDYLIEHEQITKKFDEILLAKKQIENIEINNLTENALRQVLKGLDNTKKKVKGVKAINLLDSDEEEDIEQLSKAINKEKKKTQELLEKLNRKAVDNTIGNAIMIKPDMANRHCQYDQEIYNKEIEQQIINPLKEKFQVLVNEKDSNITELTNRMNLLEKDYFVKRKQLILLKVQAADFDVERNELKKEIQELKNLNFELESAIQSYDSDNSNYHKEECERLKNEIGRLKASKEESKAKIDYLEQRIKDLTSLLIRFEEKLGAEMQTNAAFRLPIDDILDDEADDGPEIEEAPKKPKQNFNSKHEVIEGIQQSMNNVIDEIEKKEAEEENMIKNDNVEQQVQEQEQAQENKIQVEEQAKPSSQVNKANSDKVPTPNQTKSNLNAEQVQQNKHEVKANDISNKNIIEKSGSQPKEVSQEKKHKVSESEPLKAEINNKINKFSATTTVETEADTKVNKVIEYENIPPKTEKQVILDTKRKSRLSIKPLISEKTRQISEENTKKESKKADLEAISEESEQTHKELFSKFIQNFGISNKTDVNNLISLFKKFGVEIKGDQPTEKKTHSSKFFGKRESKPILNDNKNNINHIEAIESNEIFTENSTGMTYEKFETKPDMRSPKNDERLITNVSNSARDRNDTKVIEPNNKAGKANMTDYEPNNLLTSPSILNTEMSYNNNNDRDLISNSQNLSRRGLLLPQLDTQDMTPVSKAQNGVLSSLKSGAKNFKQANGQFTLLKSEFTSYPSSSNQTMIGNDANNQYPQIPSLNNPIMKSTKSPSLLSGNEKKQMSSMQSIDKLSLQQDLVNSHLGYSGRYLSSSNLLSEATSLEAFSPIDMEQGSIYSTSNMQYQQQQIGPLPVNKYIPTKEIDDKAIEDMYKSMERKVEMNPSIKNMFKKYIEKKKGVQINEDSSSNNYMDIDISFDDFRDYVKNLTQKHIKCGESCIHLKRFFEKIGFRPKSPGRPLYSIHKTDINKLPQIKRKIYIKL